MATYTELYGAHQSDSVLRDRVSVACTVKAQSLIDLATPTSGQLEWASKVLNSPSAVAGSMLAYVLAKNKALTLAQMASASDAALQSAVDAAADKLIAGGVI